eukprot:gnl/TRDRNA2_/TRDRNA2_67031_c0_seq1.p1 gnl/TRDRNA2_/TRDRNA2_67031_c0~~gnl/TRDRNA2_/TRDRNA2_67031_c0_seq1.p1  ORF type:complete len:134 (+),score=29.28 gnl/TRDRNA2_/TRDRNA2_67031_c0_seq1:201-602(+)
MGGAMCVCANGDDTKNKDLVEPPRADKEVAVFSATDEQQPSLKIGGEASSLLEKIQGNWIRQIDGRAMGEIKNSAVVWEDSYQHESSPLRLGANGELEMQLAGSVYRANYQAGNEETLTWDDGEVWVRVVLPK